MLQDHLRQEIHAWFARPDHATDPARLEQYRTILSAQEAVRYRRFHFPADSHRYLIAHALLRTTLSKYADLSPSDWTFTQGSHGRPEISNLGVPVVRFNLTHTTGLVGCLVTLESDCGIDVESVHRRHKLAGVAKRMFSEEEYHELLQLAGSRRRDYFFSRWTLREAYVKALGIGISFPTRKLSFTIARDDTVEAAFQPELEDDARHWQFRLLRPTPEHIAAIAVRKNNGLEKQLVVRTVEL